MRYEDIRSSIRDGSIVFFKAASWRSKIISLVTGGMYSHCGIAVRLRDSRGVERVMLLESTSGGCRVVNLSSYNYRSMLICDIDLRLDGPLADYAFAKTGHVKYGYWDFITIGFKSIMLRLGLMSVAQRVPDTNGEVCSEMVAAILKKAKYPIASSLVAPDTLLKLVRPMSLSVIETEPTA
jgi:hypothetical protein